jgi:hypothetical protein
MHPEPVDLLQMPLPRRRDTEIDWFELEDWVGPGRPSRRADVAKIEGILAGSGDYSLARTQGPTGWWGLALDEGIRAYQRRNGLAVDGALRPDGPTIRHMRGAFADKLGRWQPPTPDDIDAHHAAIDAGGDDVVAWRPAPVFFDRIGALPEIDAETDASNARLVRAMGRIGGYGTYPELFARTIGEFGASGLAEVRDVVSKYDAEHPGEGGHLAAEIVSRVPPETLKELDIEVPDGPPPGVKIAAGPAALLPLLPWAAGALGIGAAAVHGAKETQKILNQKLPGFTPAPAGNDNRLPPAHVPDPGPTSTGHPAPKPLGPTDTGHPIPAPDPSSVHTPTQSPDERREELANLVGNYLENRIFGGRRDFRGNDLGIDTTTAIASVCIEEARNSELPELLAHRGGGNLNGEEKEYLEETTIRKDRIHRRSDFAIAETGATDPRAFGHINGYTSKADGSPIAREVEAFLDMLLAVEDPELVGMVRKLRPGEDIAEFRENVVRPVCRKVVGALVRRQKAKLAEKNDDRP